MCHYFGVLVHINYIAGGIIVFNYPIPAYISLIDLNIAEKYMDFVLFEYKLLL